MSLLFVACAGLAVAGAIGVILAKSPVHSVLALVINLLAVAVLFLTLEAEFMAIIQVIVYAGAVMVLFLFVIALLTARKDPLEWPKGQLRNQERPGMILGGLFMVVLILGGVAYMRGDIAGIATGFGGVESFGWELLVTHVFPLQLAAIVLLVAVVGVVMLVGRRQV